MEHFVTLFDKTYLPQGLSLYSSMKSKISEYTLWVVCMDQETFNFLNNLNLENLRCLNFIDYETNELKEVKPSRSRVEYFWTVTPFVSDFVFNQNDDIERVTYIDADIWFTKDPGPIFDIFKKSSKSVLITDHGYLPEYDTSYKHGKYCVQFIIFDKEKSLGIRKLWQNNCLKWCFARNEDCKFGDQKYLDDWPKLFSNQIHILEDFSLTQAPWNSLRFKTNNAIFFHFHGLKIISPKSVFTGNYYLNEEAINDFYYPYLEDIRESLERITKTQKNIILQGKKPNIFKKFILELYIAFKVRKWRLPRIILKWN